jgi:hypothetical protein
MPVDKEVIRAWLEKNVSSSQVISMFGDPPPATRLEIVRVWLEDNVFIPPRPQEITISDIQFDWKRLSGSFRLAVDNCAIKDLFDVWIEIDGKPRFCPPMFCSPLGAPASYAAVQLDSATNAAIIRALDSVLPRLRGYGLYKELGLEIWGNSPLEDRIMDQAQFLRMKAKIDSNESLIRKCVGGND